MLTDYLFDNLAAKPALEIDTAGRAILERACTGCHSLNGIENYCLRRRRTLQRIGPHNGFLRGHAEREPRKTTLIRYLFMTYGKR